MEQIRRGAPFFSYSVGLLCTEHCKHFCGDTYKSFKIIYHDDNIYYLFDVDATAKTGIENVKKIMADPKHLEWILSEWDKSVARFVRKIERIKGLKLEELSNEELHQLNIDIDEEFKYFYSVGVFVETLDFGIPKLLSEKLRDKIREKKKLNDYMAILLAVPEESFMKEREKSLLEILSMILRDSRAAEEFRKGHGIDALKHFPAISKAVEKHVEEFFYTPCNYFDLEALSFEDVVASLQDLAKAGMNPAEEMEKFLAKQEEIVGKKKRAIEELGLDSEARGWLKIVDKYNRMHDERKKYQLMQFYYVGLILKEAARRTSTNIDLVKFLLPQEFLGFLKGKVGTETLKARREYSFFDFEKRPVKILLGKEAKEAEAKVWETTTMGAEEITGMCASPGTARGRVKIVLSPQQCSKLAEGDILVTGMTTPDFVPFMGKTGAIVTDDGGITCHAAIVARELGIPCITGTKTATKSLKDNDFVEVKASHGLVRKIGEE